MGWKGSHECTVVTRTFHEASRGADGALPAHFGVTVDNLGYARILELTR